MLRGRSLCGWLSLEAYNSFNFRDIMLKFACSVEMSGIFDFCNKNFLVQGVPKLFNLQYFVHLSSEKAGNLHGRLKCLGFWISAIKITYTGCPKIFLPEKKFWDTLYQKIFIAKIKNPRH